MLLQFSTSDERLQVVDGIGFNEILCNGIEAEAVVRS